MKATAMFSRRKICANVSLTEVVPAPDEPVTDMMGCLSDISAPTRLSAEQAALSEQRRTCAMTVRVRVVAGQQLDLLDRAEDQRHAFMQGPGREIEDPPA